MSSSSLPQPTSPPRYSPGLAYPSPRPSISSTARSVELTPTRSGSAGEPSSSSASSSLNTSDSITRLASGQTPLLFSSPQVINQRSLFPDPHAAKNRLDLRKDGVHLTLLQKFVFIHPPSPCDGNGENGKTGKDGRVNGFVHVTAAKDRTVEGIRVTLLGRQRLLFPCGNERAEESEILRREIVLGGPGTDGIHLKQGLNSFEFSFQVPASTATYESVPSGSARHDVSVSVKGGKKGLFGQSDLTDEVDLYFVAVPSRDEGVLSLSLSESSFHPSLGPTLIKLSSSQLTVGAPLDILLHLASPPPGLTIFAVKVYIVQSIDTTSTRDPTKTHQITRPKAYILELGAAGPYGATGSARRMRKEGQVLWENGPDGGGEWTLEKIARMPDDAHMRPTTHSGTEASIRVSNEIVVDIMFSLPTCSTSYPEPSSSFAAAANEKVWIATVVRQPIIVCSCCALVASVVLPDYQECPTAPFMLPTNNCPCMCNQPWGALERRELSFRETRNRAEPVEVGRRGMETRSCTSGSGGSGGEDGDGERKIGESW